MDERMKNLNIYLFYTLNLIEFPPLSFIPTKRNVSSTSGFNQFDVNQNQINSFSTAR